MNRHREERKFQAFSPGEILIILFYGPSGNPSDNDVFLCDPSFLMMEKPRIVI
jgi:hypothetical protein